MSQAGGRLPRIDEHSVMVAAASRDVWEAMLRVVEQAFSSANGARVMARALGCHDVEPSGPRPLAVGSVVSGFRVVVADAPRELALAGHHRFSDYVLIFGLDEAQSGSTRLRAETRAEFAGLRGGIYRGLVIGTGGHALVVKNLLGAIRRRAERGRAGRSRL